MTARQPEPGTFQSMLDWLEGELRQLKSQVAEFGEQFQQSRAQVWELADQLQQADVGSQQYAAQITLLGNVPEEIRGLRERLERSQRLLAEHQEQMEMLGQQLRAEMQSERDERGELRRRSEFAETAAAGVHEKISLVEELARRMQDEMALLQQRMEQADINMHGQDARVAANAEALRRAQTDARNTSSDIERHERTLGEVNERFDRMQEGMHRLQAAAERFAEIEQEFDAVRDRVESMRQAQDATNERSTAVSQDQEGLGERTAQLERAMERFRTRAEQQDRAVVDLRHGVTEAHDFVTREMERFYVFQEKVRRRQMADLEHEIRDVKTLGRTPPND